MPTDPSAPALARPTVARPTAAHPMPAFPASAPSTARLLFYVFAFEAAIFLFYLLAGAAFGSYRNSVCNWDCNWYRQIAERGYDARPNAHGYANWAFFPLFPLLSRALMRLSGATFVSCASALNFAALFALVLAGVHYARRRFGTRDPAFVAAVFLFFPFGIWFRLPYTEAIYGLLVLLVLILAREKRWLLAGLCAGLACACRSTGVLLVGSIGLVAGGAILLDALRGRTGWRAVLVQLGWLIVFGALGAAGLLGYAAYLDRAVGDPLAFSHAMGAWDRHYGNPVGRITDALALHDLTAAHMLSFGYRSQSWLAAWALVSLPLIGWALWCGAVTEALFLFCTLLLSSSTGLESEPRYLFCNPVSIALVAVLLERLPAPARWSAPALFGAAQIVLVFAWFNLSAFMT